MGRLPSGYQELRYIESTGTQWIDTGIPPFDGIIANFEAFIPHSMAGRTLFGTGGDGGWGAYMSSMDLWDNYNDDRPFSIFSGYTGHITIAKNGRNSTFTTSAGTTNYDHGNTYPKDSRTIFLFRKNGSSRSYGIFQLFLFSLSDQNGDVLWLGVPCKRLSDGAIGMFDLVSQSFFGNSGTGEFIASAPIVEPTWGSGVSQVSRKLIMRRAEVMTPGVPLYVRGNECAQRSGGWANYNIKPIDTSYSITQGERVSLEKTAEMMDVTIVTADLYAICSNCIAAGRKIDFSKVTRVVADLSVSATSNISWNNSSLRMIISDSLNNNFAIIKESEPIVTGAAHLTKSFDGKFAFDVSDINSEGFLSFLFLRDYGNTFNCSIRSVYLK